MCGTDVGGLTDLPMSTLRVQVQHLPRYLSQPEVKAFFAAITSPRDRALFSLIYLYGLRVSEVALLLRGDVDLERGRIVVKRVKSGLWSERPLFSSVRASIAALTESAAGESDEPLFPGRLGPLQKRQIQSLFVRYRDAASLDTRYTAHCLRHSIATHLLDAGLPLEFVQDHLGHRRIDSTTIYARITNHHRIALFERLEASPWIVQPNGSSPKTSDQEEALA